MLKVFGHIYSSNENDFITLKTALKNEGFDVAYEGEGGLNGDIIKEVASLTEDTEDAES